MADKKTTTQAAEQAALDPPAAVRNDIPLLTEKDIECRVQSVSRAKTGRVGAVLLLYKDARVDMRILDQVFGPGNWQRTHEVINGNLFCNIDIWDAEKHAWVRKQDVGVESNTEKEKGQAPTPSSAPASTWGSAANSTQAPSSMSNWPTTSSIPKARTDGRKS